MGTKFIIQADDGSDSAAEAAVLAGLHAYDQQFAPPLDIQGLNLFVRGQDEFVLGGLVAFTHWGWLTLSILWLDESLRGQGLGSQLLLAAEQEAVRRGCRHSVTDTLDFQGLSFYQKHGYSVFGVLDDLPPGHQRFFLRKDLEPVT
jgi:GNAT superfamily N-acetyltransferase